MKNTLCKLALVAIGINLASCTNSFISKSEEKPQSQPIVASNTSSEKVVGGYLERDMDQFDKDKLAHALDKALKKSTEWVNANTGITYTVTPTEKLVLNGNPFCRRYTVTAEKGENTKEWTGTACVSTTDSSWQAIN